MKMINIQKAMDLLRKSRNHMSEQESYEEATTDANLASKIDEYFKEEGVSFKEGGEIEDGDIVISNDEIAYYNNAMTHILNKPYPIINR